MKKALVRTRYAYPLFHFGDGVYVRHEPAEVTLDEWTQAQVDAGLLILETEAEDSESKPNRRNTKPGSKE